MTVCWQNPKKLLAQEL